MEKFEIGDRVRYGSCGKDEIVEEIDERGYINGRYCESGNLAGVFAIPENYTLVEKKRPEFRAGDEVSWDGNTGTRIQVGKDAIVTRWNGSLGVCTDSVEFHRRSVKTIGRGSMTEYEVIKSRIEKVTAWDEGTDNLLTEMSPNTNFDGRWHCLAITAGNRGNVRILKYDGSKSHFEEVICFNYSDQCEKLKAFKSALMWFLDHSGIKKSIVGTKQEIKVEGKVYEAEIIREV